MPDTIARAEHESALKAQSEKHEAAMTDLRGKFEASKAALAGDRARMSAILGHAEAKGREAQAHHLAFNTDMTVEQAAETLKFGAKAAPPAAEAPRGGNRLSVPSPDLQPEDRQQSSADSGWGDVVKAVDPKARAA